MVRPADQPAVDGIYLLAGMINQAATTKNRQQRMSAALSESGILEAASVRRLAKRLGKSRKAVTGYDAVTAPDAILA